MFEVRDNVFENIIIERIFSRAFIVSYSLNIKKTHSFTFVRARTFDQARTFTRIFDRGVVPRQNSDLKYCRRFFYYAAGKSGMCMNFF